MITLLDQKVLVPQHALTPYALCDYFLHACAQTQQPFLHFWQQPNTVILGMSDTRLPHFRAGLNALTLAQQTTIIRNTGGLAVPNDSGILNFSYFIPNQARHLSIEEAYAKTVQLLAHALPEHVLQVGEITGSYCPGKFDLALKGQKIAGLAQRRVQEATCVMGYLTVTGEQAARSELIRTFYRAADPDNQSNCPTIESQTMTSLATFTQKVYTIESIKQKLLSYFSATQMLTAAEFTAILQDPFYLKKQQAMVTRNNLFKEELH
jgi:octanoyl-[GcvH]:protein N-octanoyltransferase